MKQISRLSTLAKLYDLELNEYTKTIWYNGNNYDFNFIEIDKKGYGELKGRFNESYIEGNRAPKRCGYSGTLTLKGKEPKRISAKNKTELCKKISDIFNGF